MSLFENPLHYQTAASGGYGQVKLTNGESSAIDQEYSSVYASEAAVISYESASYLNFGNSQVDSINIPEGVVFVAHMKNVSVTSGTVILNCVTEAFFGPELVLSGDFDQGIADWNLGGNWSISGGVAIASNTGDPDTLSQTISGIEDNKPYRVRFEVLNYASGDLEVSLGALPILVNGTSNGVYSIDIMTTSSQGNLLTFEGYALTAELDNVSIAEIL